MEPGFFKSYTEQAEAFYQQSAGHGSREATLRQQSRKLRADIARLQGQPLPALPLEDRLQNNMAVATAHRRQGLATALLHRCQRIGGLWGHSEMWLHVDVINEQAQKLYIGSGFGIKSRDSWYYIIGRKRYLMQKSLTDRSRKTRAEKADVRLAGGSIRGSDGVFVWDVQPDSNGNTKGCCSAELAARGSFWCGITSQEEAEEEQVEEIVSL
ncbi:MAG: GCN5-related N-acetyltransferase [Trebouxia sp. A1-2]|nr:MAG: GCN5-related N-acetyltransferase [Trebouxia sp. A1-2]